MKNNEKIWRVVYGIPAGQVATYGQVARLAGLPGYARYVGTVLKQLPDDSHLPWHRVVNAQGRISFPAMSSQYQLQRSLLESEGVVFVNDRLSLRKFAIQH
ncbi:MAG: MGMT family protein [Gammaproteobacteria bacterium]|nr:MGMT family protein [Pseudomonadales bacterium]MCP5345598.1 MGMT family protein [Pseudomonadales bacterium]